MAALLRSTRAAHRHTLYVRVLSTVANTAGPPNPGVERPSGSTHDKTDATPTRPAKLSAECMFVHPWNRIRSSAEGLAIARAVQDKYGPAKEVVFPRDADSVNLLHPYFWLVFDNPDVRKRFPETSARISVHVADLPRGDGNVGVEEMIRGLGLSTTTGSKDASRKLQPTPVTAQTETEIETEASKDASDAPPGYKSLDVRVEWAHIGPSEVLRRRRRPVLASLRDEELLPGFATAWLAFDGFSPESARGPDTPNLLRAREKWRNLAPAPVSASATSSPSSSSTLVSDDDSTTAAAPSHQGPVEVETESATSTSTSTQAEQMNVPPREWVPIISSTPLTQRDAPDSASVVYKNAPPADAPTPTPVDPTLVTTFTADAVADAAPTSPRPPPPPPPVTGHKMSRRERILHLARQNARTPLPEAVEEVQPQPPTEAEKLDEESERQGKERTIRERLWRLVGGNY